MKLSEAFAKSITTQGLGNCRAIPGEDAIMLPIIGPCIRAKVSGLRVDVDLNVLYHVYCKDPITVSAVHLLLSDVAPISVPNILEAFDLSWCPENEHLQAQGIQTLPAAAAMAWRMVEAAVALRTVAYATGEWDLPS